MSAGNSRNDPGVRQFWDRYINKLEKQGVKPKIARDVTASNRHEKSYDFKGNNVSLARSQHAEVLTKLIRE